MDGPPYTPPPPAILPPNERRRASLVIRLACVAASATVDACGLAAADLFSVFGSSNGDGAVVTAILEALTFQPSTISPTQFHNSVHNAAAAYWAIGQRCGRASISLGCHIHTFAAALLRATTEVATARHAVLLCVYDAPMLQPLTAASGTDIVFAAAMILTPQPIASSCASLDVVFASRPPHGWIEPELRALQRLYHANPAARSLTLLEAVARGSPTRIEIDYLDDACLVVDISP